MTKPTQLMPELLILREMASRGRKLIDDKWHLDAASDIVSEAYEVGYTEGYAVCMEDLVKTINSLNAAKERREKPSNVNADETPR